MPPVAKHGRPVFMYLCRENARVERTGSVHPASRRRSMHHVPSLIRFVLALILSAFLCDICGTGFSRLFVRSPREVKPWKSGGSLSSSTRRCGPRPLGYTAGAPLDRFVEVEHFQPHELDHVPRQGFDLYLNIDDGLHTIFRLSAGQSRFWAIDTHLDFDRCREKRPI